MSSCSYDVGNGKVLIYEKKGYSSDKDNLTDIFFLNTIDKRVEKTGYKTNNTNDNIYFLNEDFKIVFNEKNNGLNLISLVDGRLLLENDIVNVLKYSYKGFLFILDTNNKLYYLTLDVKLKELILDNIIENFEEGVKSFNNNNYVFYINKIRFIYNFDENIFENESIFMGKEKEIITFSNNNFYLSQESKRKYYRIYNRIDKKVIFDEVQYFTLINKELGFGLIILKDRILKYDKENNFEILSNNGYLRKSEQIFDCELYSSVEFLNPGYKMVLIDNGLWLNIIDFELYRVNIDFDTNNNIGVLINSKNENILIDDFGEYAKGDIFYVSKDLVFFKTIEGKYLVFGENIELQEMNILGIEDIEIINFKKENHYRSILFYSKSKNKLYLGKNDYFYGNKEDINDVYDGFYVKEIIGNANDYLKIFNLKKDFIFSFDVRKNIICLNIDTYSNGEKFSRNKNIYLLLKEGGSLKLLGEDKLEKDKKDWNNSDMKQDGLLFGNEIYIKNSIRNYGVCIENKLNDIYYLDTFYYDSFEGKNVFVLLGSILKEQNSQKVLLLFKEKLDGNFELVEYIELKSSNGVKFYIYPEEKYNYTNLFIKRNAFIDSKNNDIIFLHQGSFFRIKEENYSIDKGKANIIINLYDRENGDFFTPIDNIDNIKNIENFTKNFKKVIQLNKKEYLVDNNFNKITKKDFSKIENIIDNDLLLVKQSGMNYISNFDGIPVSKKLKKLIQIFENFYEYKDKGHSGEDKKIKNNLYLGSEDGIDFYLFDEKLNKIQVFDKNKKEIVFNSDLNLNWEHLYSMMYGYGYQESYFILTTKENKKIFFDVFNLKFNNRTLFDEIKIFNNGTFKGTIGRDIYHYNIENEDRIYDERYYDVIGSRGDFLIVEDRRDFILLNRKDGKPINNNSYKEVLLKNYQENVLEVMDFDNKKLFINILGEEFISVASNYGISNKDNYLKNLITGKIIFDGIKFKIIHQDTYGYDNGIILEDENKNLFLISLDGKIILGNKKKIQFIQDRNNNIEDKNIFILAKEGREKFSLFDINGNLLDEEILTEYNYMSENYIVGEISGVRIKYFFNNKKVEFYD